MPKNKGKGGKNRRRGKNENEGLKRELVFKEDGQEYAQVRLSLIRKAQIHREMLVQNTQTHTNTKSMSTLR